MSAADLLASAVYIATSSLIGLGAHVLRYQLTERELAARIGLEQEQAHTGELLARLERLSHEDPLTGLANRRRWDTELDAACERARSSGAALAVVLIDVDRFKQINDGYGHEGGDTALRAVAALLVGHVPSSGLVARLGGDELAVLLPGRDARAAAEYAEHVREAALTLHTRGEAPCPVSLSLGVAAATGVDVRPPALLREADAHLYRAKELRNAVGAAHLHAVPRQTTREEGADATSTP